MEWILIAGVVIYMIAGAYIIWDKMYWWDEYTVGEVFAAIAQAIIWPIVLWVDNDFKLPMSSWVLWRRSKRYE